MCYYVPSNKVVHMCVFTTCCEHEVTVHQVNTKSVGSNPLMILNYQNNALFDMLAYPYRSVLRYARQIENSVAAVFVANMSNNRESPDAL